jgi:hypothetical protein
MVVSTRAKFVTPGTDALVTVCAYVAATPTPARQKTKEVLTGWEHEAAGVD